MTLSHLDGHSFSIKVNDVTECDHVLRVPGKGMPRRNGRGFGDLYLINVISKFFNSITFVSLSARVFDRLNLLAKDSKFQFDISRKVICSFRRN